jgi:hypothetical protein
LENKISMESSEEIGIDAAEDMFNEQQVIELE